MSKYRWIPNASACSTCQGMASTTYPSPPKRPHKYCQCAYVGTTGNTQGGPADRVPRIIGLRKVGGSTEYHDGNKPWEEQQAEGRENFHASGEYEFEATILCPSNDEVTVNVNVVLQDGDLYDVLEKWANTSTGDETTPTEEYEEMNDEPWEQEINEAVDDYSGGLEFKARELVMQLLRSRNGPCDGL